MSENQSSKPLTFRPDVTKLAAPQPMRTWRSRATFFASAAAILAFVFVNFHKGNELYNPGPVTFAHARIEHDCIQCHDGNGKGGFLKTVSDIACLKCHDGSIHHPNQQIRSPADPHVNLVLAVHDPNHPFGMRSTDCVTCHTEHRGPEALRSTSDTNCIKCHDNLKDHAQNPADVHEQNSVTTFAEGSHPNFGRQLMKDGQLFDPTVLKFNHYVHLTKFKSMQTDCTSCHATTASGNRSVPSTQPSAQFTVASDRRYMQPVSYEHNCIGCHQISIGKIADLQPAVEAKSLPHEPIFLLKGIIADMVHNAAEQPAASFKHATTDRRNRSVITPIKQSEWMGWTIAGLNQRLKPSIGDPGITGQWLKTPDMTKQSTAFTESQVVNFYAASIALSSDGCIKCHAVTATFPTLDPADHSGTQIITTPTGIPDSPRRWFTSSRFDHDAHRDVSCLDCHTKLANIDSMERGSDAALFASRTSSVLSPDTIASCIKCHHADTAKERGAPASCITCHDYHDRTKER